MLQTELARKLTSTDAALKDSISKLVRSKVKVALLFSELHATKYTRHRLGQTEIPVAEILLL